MVKQALVMFQNPTDTCLTKELWGRKKNHAHLRATMAPSHPGMDLSPDFWPHMAGNQMLQSTHGSPTYSTKRICEHNDVTSHVPLPEVMEERGGGSLGQQPLTLRNP